MASVLPPKRDALAGCCLLKVFNAKKKAGTCKMHFPNENLNQ